MSAKILVNGIEVSQVQPNTTIQLAAHDIGAWTTTVEFLVTNSQGIEVLRQWVSVRLSDAWLDWQAPSVPGKYTFYAGIDMIFFEVTSMAVTPAPISSWTENILPALGETKWIVIAIAVVAIAVLIFLYIPRR